MSTPSEVQPVPPTTSANVVQEGFDIPSSPRYRLNVAGSGSFRPGTPVTLTVDVESVKGTGATDLELYLPELTAFEASPGAWRGIPRDTRMTPAQNRELSLSPGLRAGHPFTVVFPEPGLYTVQVIARQRAPDAVRDWTPQSAATNAWVLVLEDGGRFSPVYDTTMILRDAISTGPFRHVDPQRQGLPVSGVTAFRGGENQFCEVDCPPRNCCFGGSLTYTEPFPGQQILPLGGVTVQLSFNTGELFQTVASTGGYGGLPCPNPGENGFLSFVTISSAFTVRDHGSAGSTFANVSSAVCGTTLMAHNTVLPGPLVFAHMTTARNNGGNLFGKVRGPLSVDIETPPAEDSPSFYSTSQDRIHIMDTQTGVGDPFGFGSFVAAHEYGHALQAAAFAHGAPGMGTCNNPHAVETPNTAGCAISEGWADYFSISVIPTNLWDFESNPWVLNFPFQGSQIEGAVVAYYLDMSDPVNASEADALSLGTRFVADIISSCENWDGAGAATIAELSSCFNNNLEPGFKLTPPVTFPSGWTLSGMEQNYDWNILGCRGEFCF